ncbi:immunoglobulin superfamily member 8 [Epinephelus fuscoguttatus]|uniref:immunoglobulin superfamily member 8 n=1 Tax=Epinephelus fuscoguttatus TaxID=293821 RepID=UPI0020D10EA0|nr:immunoglobulin superfamily member 8 [Epinephelus fuscoguttatus]XP_049447719.1 immunoglobulin superfamily member 8 [Epinephelus fuscoguttatus]XP_049447728.1 immunoglobulin superfamily member 8 [Epinephelus fuscoguttatus]XP_049447737.1 immunoglobulin superfamily member 8 [Epinephelus fuscoguttatus]XP_049447744.1 immunoglobulin superfamily member 8 [Epinephelus fuscoguttatus]
MRTMMASMKTALFVFLQWVLQYAVCRDVTLPIGTLYRVAGFPLSLPCAVSGYEGPRTQHFEWFLYRDDAAGRQIGVVSTRDKGFPYAPFQPRVRNGEVRVERDSGDKVRLVIQRLRAEDQGMYECYTPSTDSTYQGNYSGKVTVKVIPDTLQISYTRSLTSQPVPEGAELTLTCSAGIQSEQLTHLSITFGKRSGGEGMGSGVGGEVSTVREIISIDKLLGVVPGHLYKKRYDSGEITLEKRNGEAGQDVYVMKMKAVQPDDSGSYFCEAAQWILDPDRSWQKIAQRTLDIGNLTVQQLAESLSITSSPRGEVTLQVGSPLILTCEVLGLPSEVSSGLLVQWMKRGSVSSDVTGSGGVEVEVARLSPNGIVSWGDDLSRASGGSLEKVAEGKYSLKLFSARPLDSGVYRCVVSVYAGRSNPGPSTPATITQRSEGVTVNLKSKDVLVAAVAQLPRGPLLKRGSTITLICNATVTTTGPAQAQVQWLRWPIPERVIKKDESRASDVAVIVSPVEDKPTLVAVLMYDGVAKTYTNGSEISIDRLSAGSYRLRVHSATMDDQGMYACHAQAWGQDPHGGWYNTGAKAESNAVTVYLYARAADLLLIPLVVGVSSALFVGIVIIATVTCCFMKRLARQRAQK